MPSHISELAKVQLAHNIECARALLKAMEGCRPRPLTRWERMKFRLQDYRERVVLAWRVLRGDDIHDDCY